MELVVQLIGVILRILNLLLVPYFWLRTRNSPSVPPIKDPLLFFTATELAEGIRNGELSSESVVAAYVARIQEVNPLINAVVEERYQAALREAREVDRLIADARNNGKIRYMFDDKPLLGVPFTVKESCSLAGVSNAVGCLEHVGRKATKDGETVALVKRAGAIPLLVSNTPELCLGWETANLLTGTTNNPYCLKRTAGGSSGGEAALLASGASAFGVASDIAGSIRIPAAFCGVYGHKPTPGIIPIEGHIPTLQDENYSKFLTMGPMSRFAGDLPLLLTVMAGDAAPLLRLQEPVDLKQIKVYYMTEATKSIGLIDVDRSIKEAIVDAARYLQTECGSTLSEEKFEEFADSVEMSVSEFFTMKDLPNMLQDPANPKHEKSLLVELCKSAVGCSTRSAQALGFAHVRRTQLHVRRAARPLYRARLRALRSRLEDALRTGVLLYPAHSGVAHAHGGVAARASGVLYTMLFNVLGLPAVTVPLPHHSRLPVALQIISAPYQDRLCLAVARELEKGFGGWTPPAGAVTPPGALSRVTR